MTDVKWQNTSLHIPPPPPVDTVAKQLNPVSWSFCLSRATAPFAPVAFVDDKLSH